MICAIHQPNLFPWYPFFQKMESCDVFVILLHCQFEKNNYQNRFKLQGRFREWNTLAVGKKIEKICEKKYLDPVNDFNRIINNLPEHEAALKTFRHIVEESDSLCSVNTEIIIQIAEWLKIQTHIAYDYPTPATGTQRLVEMCKTQNCNTYLSGIGGKKYLDEKLFADNGIKIVYQTDMVLKPILEVI